MGDLLAAYEEALRFYANRECYLRSITGGKEPVLVDAGSWARDVLARAEELLQPAMTPGTRIHGEAPRTPPKRLGP